MAVKEAVAKKVKPGVTVPGWITYDEYLLRQPVLRVTAGEGFGR